MLPSKQKVAEFMSIISGKISHPSTLADTHLRLDVMNSVAFLSRPRLALFDTTFTNAFVLSCWVGGMAPFRRTQLLVTQLTKFAVLPIGVFASKTK